MATSWADQPTAPSAIQVPNPAGEHPRTTVAEIIAAVHGSFSRYFLSTSHPSVDTGMVLESVREARKRGKALPRLRTITIIILYEFGDGASPPEQLPLG